MRTGPLGDLGLAPTRLRTFDGLSQAALHRELSRRRVYVHSARWTSLGLSLLEAMHLGLPVVALATTDVVTAVPPRAGVISTRPEDLLEAIRHFMSDADHARVVGSVAREVALARYGLARFLSEWDDLLAGLVAR
jgi:glycosyltransferase involved in cell wall biosynthesis